MQNQDVHQRGHQCLWVSGGLGEIWVKKTIKTTKKATTVSVLQHSSKKKKCRLRWFLRLWNQSSPTRSCLSASTAVWLSSRCLWDKGTRPGEIMEEELHYVTVTFRTEGPAAHGESLLWFLLWYFEDVLILDSVDRTGKYMYSSIWGTRLLLSFSIPHYFILALHGVWVNLFDIYTFVKFLLVTWHLFTCPSWRGILLSCSPEGLFTFFPVKVFFILLGSFSWSDVRSKVSF